VFTTDIDHRVGLEQRPVMPCRRILGLIVSLVIFSSALVVLSAEAQAKPGRGDGSGDGGGGGENRTSHSAERGQQIKGSRSADPPAAAEPPGQVQKQQHEPPGQVQNGGRQSVEQPPPAAHSQQQNGSDGTLKNRSASTQPPQPVTQPRYSSYGQPNHARANMGPVLRATTPSANKPVAGAISRSVSPSAIAAIVAQPDLESPVQSAYSLDPRPASAALVNVDQDRSHGGTGAETQAANTVGLL
jgi:hypothetical protein